MKKLFLIGLFFIAALTFLSVENTDVKAAHGDIILHDDLVDTFYIGATGRAADELGNEYGQNGNPAAPSPYPFRDTKKFSEQENLRPGRVNPDATNYMKNRWNYIPSAQDSSITYEAANMRGFQLQFSMQIWGQDDPILTSLERVTAKVSSDGITYETVTLNGRVIDRDGVNYLIVIDNKTTLAEGTKYLKLEFKLKNTNFWELALLDVKLTGQKVNGDVIFEDNFNNYWELNPEGRPLGHGTEGFIFEFDETKVKFSSQNKMSWSRVFSDPAKFTYNDWMLGIGSQNESSLVYEIDGSFYNFSLVIYRQLWDNSLPLADAVKVSVSNDGENYEQVTIDSNILRQTGPDTYLSVFNKAPLSEGYKFIKIDFAHANGNLWELAITNVRLMNNKESGSMQFVDDYNNLWDLNPEGRPLGHGTEGFAFTFDDNRIKFLSQNEMTWSRVFSDPAKFTYNDWMLGIKSQNQSNVVYETDSDFFNFSLKVYRQLWDNSLPLADAVKVSVSKDNVSYTPVTIDSYILKQSGPDTFINVYNKAELEEGYRYIKIEFAHANGNLWELALSRVELQGKTNDQFGVIDRTKPELTVTWDLEAEYELNTLITLPVPTASDDTDENPLVTISVYSPYDSKVTVTDNQFRLTMTGQYSIVYKAVDKTGNFTEQSFTISVVYPAEETPAPVNNGLPTGAIIGIILGGVALVGGVSFLAMKKFKK